MFATTGVLHYYRGNKLPLSTYRPANVTHNMKEKGVCVTMGTALSYGVTDLT